MSFSTVAKGNAFERHAVHLLNTDLRMAVRRVGGRGDGGIDLRGYWWLPLAASKSKRRSGSESSASDAETPPRPSTPELESHTFRVPPGLRRTGLPNTREIAPLRIIAQCKAESARVGPKYVRELAGTLGSLDAAPISAGGAQTKTKAKTKSKLPPLVGILLSQSGFSTAAVRTASQSDAPMLLIHLPGGYPGEEFWSEEGAVGEGDGADESEGLSDTAVEVDGSTTADLDANLAPDQPAAQLAPGQDHGPAPTTDVCGVWWNRPFADLVPPPIEIRRELSPTPETARVGIWYFGGRMGRYGPRGV